MKTIKWAFPVLTACVLILAAWMTAAGKKANLLQGTEGPSQGFRIVVNLDASNSEPTSPLVQAAGGKLYGAGTLSNSIFATTPSGVLTTIHKLRGMEGAGPSGVIQGTDGNFYGVASAGGANSRGTIFKITPSGVLTLLYTFCPQDMQTCPDGKFPDADLLQASDGNFYGVTANGGKFDSGTVFRITPGGVFTTVHRFTGTDGYTPEAALIQGTDGYLYGTTQFGGSSLDETAFKMTLDGSLTVLHVFSGPDGSDPHSALIQASDGNFYGTTYLGGANLCGGSGCGTVFRITSDGNFTTIHNFDGTDGRQLESALIQATDGKLYGTPAAGGAGNQGGTVFRMTLSGNIVTLYSFCSQGGNECTDGAIPYGPVQYTDGTIYGITQTGGANADGTIYRIALGLPAFVRTLPLTAQVGTMIRILGTNLTGTTSVKFHGVTADFKVKSQSNIEATVPSGATTGLVQVTTPQGTLTSNVPFQVLP